MICIRNGKAASAVVGKVNQSMMNGLQGASSDRYGGASLPLSAWVPAGNFHSEAGATRRILFFEMNGAGGLQGVEQCR
jgi:hypothetical protein